MQHFKTHIPLDEEEEWYEEGEEEEQGFEEDALFEDFDDDDFHTNRRFVWLSIDTSRDSKVAGKHEVQNSIERRVKFGVVERSLSDRFNGSWAASSFRPGCGPPPRRGKGQIITTSHDLTPNGALVEEIFYFREI